MKYQMLIYVNQIRSLLITDINLQMPILHPNHLANTANSFTEAMRRSLADSINLQGKPLSRTNFIGRSGSSPYYQMMRTNIRDRFNLKIIPVLSDGNCLFRALSHIIFGNESEHNSVRLSLINTFEHSDYVAAFCGIQGYNDITIQQHFSDMKSNYTWGTVNEQIMLGILARINVCYLNAADNDPTKWVITEVYNENTLGIPNDPIYEGKSLMVLFHSINFSGPSANHYDALYKF